MNAQPTLSIIVPVYNKGEFIDLCLNSIINQTFADFELILVNDGSTDNSPEICDAFAAKDSRVTAIHQANGGVSSARNAGLEVARGRYIGFADSDDILDTDMYELLVNNALKYGADISICGVRRVSPSGEELFGDKGILHTYTRDQGIAALLRGEMLLSNYDKIFRKDTVQHIRFKPALFEDTFYNFEALLHANTTVYDDTVKYSYMIRDNSHSMSAFGPKYMTTVTHTRKIREICEKQLPHHVDDAKMFDFASNMFVLNLILLAGKDEYPGEFRHISSNLKDYSGFYAGKRGIKARYKFGFGLFQISPALYATVLKSYSALTNSEHLTRKKDKNPVQAI